jgi:tetratricopeptide (TPR) repeat protein
MSVKAQRPAARRPAPEPRPVATPVPDTSAWWMPALVFAAALLIALIVYWPAMHGAFVFDDAHMQFAEAHPDRIPLSLWIRGSRPLVGLSYWLNYQASGTSTFGYHLTNIVLHVLASLIVFLILRKTLELAGFEIRRRTLAAAFCGALFLLHPVQTEAVAYIAARSENLSVLLAFAAWACFLYRRSSAIQFPAVIAILALFGASVAAKEHVAVLPAVILLTDYYWNPGFSFQGIRRNWRLYGVFLVSSLAVAAFFWSYLAHEPTVGFNMQQFTWYQYFFTQCRVIFIYLRLFLLPFGQTADYFVELSRTPFEHGAIFGMAALAAGSIAAIVWRKRFPLASYGFFVTLIFFLPTSSIVPIKDLAAERRLYLPFIGLLFILAEGLVRIRWDERKLIAAFAAILVVAGGLTWNRSFVWNDAMSLWSDTVEKSPRKSRAQFGLATALFSAHRYPEAVRHYELADGPEYAKDGLFYSNWALALRGAGKMPEAIRLARKAAELRPGAPTYSHLAMFLAEEGEIRESLELLIKAEKADSTYEPLYIELGNILGQTGHREQACIAFQKAWTLDPNDASAVKGLTLFQCGAAPAAR